MAAYMTVQTHKASPRELREYWTDYIDRYVMLAEQRYPVGPPPPSMQAILQTTGSYRLHTFRDPVNHFSSRQPRHVARDVRDEYTLFMPTTGQTLVRTDTAESVIRPGMAGIASNALPWEYRTDQTLGQLLTIPATAVDARLNSKEPMITAVDVSRGVGHMAMVNLWQAYKERDALTEDEFNTVIDHALILLGKALGRDQDPTEHQLSLIAESVRRYVREHAADRTLDLPSVALALGWSQRKIQGALGWQGTQWRATLVDERLEVARRHLKSWAMRGATIDQIARMSGLGNAANLGMLHKGRHGESPGEYRARMLAGGAAVSPSVPPTGHDWR